MQHSERRGQLKTRSDTTLGHKERTAAVSSGEVDHGPIMVSHVSQFSNIFKKKEIFSFISFHLYLSPFSLDALIFSFVFSFMFSFILSPLSLLSSLFSSLDWIFSSLVFHLLSSCLRLLPSCLVLSRLVLSCLVLSRLVSSRLVSLSLSLSLSVPVSV